MSNEDRHGKTGGADISKTYDRKNYFVIEFRNFKKFTLYKMFAMGNSFSGQEGITTESEQVVLPITPMPEAAYVIGNN